MIQFRQLLRNVLANGVDKTDRTGTGTRSLFAETMRFDMDDGFPLVTSKYVPFKSIKAELLWFLRGGTNVDWLHQHGCTIWDEWADENGDLGPIYGKQWRSWPINATGAGHGSVDQLANVIRDLRENPDSRRHLVSAWNVEALPAMALPPCHVLFQFYSRPMAHQEQARKLDLMLYQRSADLFLGVPFNIASYALLLHMVAQVTGHVPGEFTWVGGDCHIYKNHFRQVELLLEQDPQCLPRLVLNPDVMDIDEFEIEDIQIEGYKHGPKISAPVAV